MKKRKSMGLTLLNLPQWAVESFKQKDGSLRKYFSKADGSETMMFLRLHSGLSSDMPHGLMGSICEVHIGVSLALFGWVKEQRGVWLLQSQIPRLFPSQPNHDVPITIFFQPFYISPYNAFSKAVTKPLALSWQGSTQ